METVNIVIICLLLWILVIKPNMSGSSTKASDCGCQGRGNPKIAKAAQEHFEERSNISEYVELPQQLRNANIRFYGAHWCGACKAQMKLCEEAGIDLDDIFYNVDEHRDSARQHKANAIPHWVELDDDGEVVSSRTGVQQLADLSAWSKTAKSQSKKNKDSEGTKSDLGRLLKDNNLRFYGAEWCGACNMQKNLLKDNNISLEDIYYDIDEHKEAGEKYEIKAFPTWVKLEHSGKKLDEKVGVQDIEQLKSWCN